jgi:hypothetical protein
MLMITGQCGYSPTKRWNWALSHAFPQHHPPTAQKNELKHWRHGAPLRRQLRSAPNGAGIDGRFHAHPAYPNLRKERATRACGEGPRREKSPTFWVVHARRVWRKLHCLNPSPTAYPGVPTEGGHKRWDQRLRVFLVLTLVSIGADVPCLRGE